MEDLEEIKAASPTEKKMHISTPGVWRDRIAVILMVVAAVISLGAFVMIILGEPITDPALQVTALWQALTYIVLAGLFLLLANAPRAYPGVWELSIFLNVAMAIGAFVLTGMNAAGAELVFWIEGTIALLIIISYVLSNGDRAWRRFRHL
jgi:hypothetical protein